MKTQVIDSHQHFWQYDSQKHSWMSDDMGAIKRDFMPIDLVEIYQTERVDGCVAVQADQTEGESLFLTGLAEKHDFIKGVVGWVDLRSDSVVERLEHFSQFEKIKGFRHVVQDEPDPEFMLQDSFMNGIHQLEQFGFRYDILVFQHQLPTAIHLAQHFPNQLFVLDHIAKPLIAEGKINKWRKSITELSKCDNVFCKVSGMITEANWANWQFDDLKPYLDVVFETFGTKRIMYGSDWPVCLLASEYRRMKSVVDSYIGSLSQEEQSAVMGQNASNFYGLA